MADLKPCPFAHDDDLPPPAIQRHPTAGYHYAACECGATGPARSTVEEAVTAWNRRAPLADLAVGGDAQREEDAKWCEMEAECWATRADKPVDQFDRDEADRYRRLARYAREGGWRAMDGALRDRKGHFLAGHPEHGVTECWRVRDTEHPWGVALMTPDGPLPDRASAHWRWRPLPAPPKENEDGR